LKKRNGEGKKKTFLILDHQTSASSDLPSSVSVDDDGGGSANGDKKVVARDLMIDVEGKGERILRGKLTVFFVSEETDDDGGSYEIGATPHSVEIPKDVLDSNAREAALFVSDTENRLAERLAEEEYAKQEARRQERVKLEEQEQFEAMMKSEQMRLEQEKRKIEQEERKILESLNRKEDEEGSDFDSGISQESAERKPSASVQQSKAIVEEDQDEEEEEDRTSSEVALATPGAFS
jgi:hypothetical protein